jgi:L,D-transpeptidase ErfK/SrfK
MNRRTTFLALTLILAAVTGLFAFGISRRPAEAPDARPSSETLQLRVDLSDRQLQVIERGTVIKTYDVTVGSNRHPTPSGAYRIDWIVWNPSWNPPNSDWARGKQPIGPGPDNPMGRVKMFFRQPAYYVHGTNAESEIGQAASHGCVRMLNGDVIELAQVVMEHGGEAREPNWFRRVINKFRDTREVTLSRPVEVEIGA